MKKEEWEEALATPTTDGRVYKRVDVSELAEHKNCLIKAKRYLGYGEYQYYAGGILHHVDAKHDPPLYLYIRICGTPSTFPLPTAECEFWVIPAAATDKEIKQWEDLLAVEVKKINSIT